MAATTRSETLTTVTGIVATVFAMSPDDLAPHLDLRGIEGVDSVKVLRVVATAEQRFGVELEDDSVFGLHTIAELVAAIEKAEPLT